MGLSLDWSREIATCDPSYYRHEQAMFIDFMAAGLVERKVSMVNWDPVDQTVLANEQVIEGRGWRSGALVEKRELAQWFLKITDYSRRAARRPSTGSTSWPEKVRLMQRNWIGRSEGMRFSFALEDERGPAAPRQARRLHDPPRHDFRRQLLRPLGRPSADPNARAESRPEARRISAAKCAALGTSEEAIERAEKKGCPLELYARHPFRAGRALAGLCRQFRADGLWRGRHFRLPGP